MKQLLDNHFFLISFLNSESDNQKNLSLIESILSVFVSNLFEQKNIDLIFQSSDNHIQEYINDPNFTMKFDDYFQSILEVVLLIKINKINRNNT